MARAEKTPSWLDEVAAEEYKRILKLLKKEKKEFTQKDLKTLEGYAKNYSTWRRCEEIVQEKGYTFCTPNGYEQQRPEVSIGNKAQERMLACSKELGLTPASRARMGKNVPNEEGKTKEELEMEGLIS